MLYKANIAVESGDVCLDPDVFRWFWHRVLTLALPDH